MNPADAIHLRRADTSVVLEVPPNGMPVVVYWGADLGEVSFSELRGLVLASLPQRVSGGLDLTARASVLPLAAEGWQYEPGLEGSRTDGSDFTPRFEIMDVTVIDSSTERTEPGLSASASTSADEASGTAASGTTVTIVGRDEQAGLMVRIDLNLGETGLLSQRLTVRNDGVSDYRVQRLQATFPLPSTAREILDATGRHLKERSPQRHPFTIGEHTRTSRRGRPGADATLMVYAGTPGFGFRTGNVHGVHVAWSGDHRLTAVRTPTGQQLIQAGEQLAAGEIILAAGESYSSPRVIGTWGDGLDASAWRFHAELRARPQHPSSPRPVTVNTWEAVYFDHDLDRLTTLADRAAEVGAERFVLDDGWFRGRRDDTSGLGDWYVDDGVWPDGLGPLVSHVTGLGMQFGLWVEPEMANPDSDLARQHPEWILHPSPRWPIEGRQQQVLDLGLEAVRDYLVSRLDALLTEYDISYLKWDHNRDLIEAAVASTGRSAVHSTTQGLYAVLDELRRRHPAVEIETCASGGARVDLEILQRTQRVWVSDCIDPIERLDNQAFTNLLVPYEMLGCHVGDVRSHSTQRVSGLDFQAITALFGHFGIESDLTGLSGPDRARLGEWVAAYKRYRDLFHTGQSVHADVVDPSVDVRGVVAPDRLRAVFAVTQRAASVSLPGGLFTLPGLDPARTYRVALAAPLTELVGPGQSPLAWLAGAEPLLLRGAMLEGAGLQLPVLYPGSAVLLEVTAV